MLNSKFMIIFMYFVLISTLHIKLCIIYKRCNSSLQNDGSFTVDTSFNAPAPIDETAMEDEPLPTEISTGPVETTYHTVSAGTSRGNLKLVDNIGFTYTVKVNKK